MQTFSVKTSSRVQMVDITAQVAEAIAKEGIADGLAVVFVPHTTAGITINENADPDVVHDMLADLDRLFPRTQPYYRHGEG
ncbi:MAG TPA: secondary thiamine-phosphate synthase enzyme YjbQ, partial [Phycisphaerae bacterium]|nr:secondary thiamine-phosphate synthase enzyme YjbQ [Phycisphaerae bacterium]